ncbi:unnamed protein product [Phaedon cochleariae]|uniref:Myb-like domain-containing protein n=1 Tax=Phaedon cochleariae TaxID=80249 RepID=A0A9N9X5U0_PHACE|nr:unnamed protein product [Phaedon cochleariae]
MGAKEEDLACNSTKNNSQAKEKIPSVVISKAWQDYHESKERKKKEEEERKIKKAEERRNKRELQIKLKEQKKAAKDNKAKVNNHSSKKRTYRCSFSSDSETSASWKSSGSSDGIQNDNMGGNGDEEEQFHDENMDGNGDEGEQLLVDIGNQDRVFKESDHVLVEFPGRRRQHKYVCVIQRLLSEGEAEVVAMKRSENTEFFKLNEDDDLELTKDMCFCGYCQEELGTLANLMAASCISHICLKSYDDLNVDMKTHKIWGSSLKPCAERIETDRNNNASSSGSSTKPPAEPCKERNKTDRENKASSSGSSTKPPSDRKEDTNNWSDQETKLLICLYTEHKHKFLSPMYNKKNVWNIISERLKELGTNKSALKCDEKWRNMKKTYDKVLKDKKLTGNSNSYWRYFDDFHEIYFHDPLCTVSSTGSIKTSIAPKISEDVPIETSSEEQLAKKRKVEKAKESKTLTSAQIEDRRQQRHKEKMKMKAEMFSWFKENFGSNRPKEGNN